MFNNQIIAGSSGQGGSFYPYSIDQSLRVDDTASQRMYHNTVAGDAQKFTMSCWIKRTELSDNGTIMSSWNGASNFVNMYFSGDYLYCYICDNRSGFVDYNFTTYASPSGIIYYRDVSAWMHVVYAVDSTQSTATDRFTIWVNGVNTNARSAGSGNDIPLNYNMEINEAGGQNFLFNNPDSASYYGSFYIADMVYVDGTKYDADTFGEFKNGIWIPLDISTQSIAYGNNGFYLDFADSSDLGKDVSGEGNHFTPGTRSAVVQNFSAHDQVLDSPTNNFATLNPLQNSGGGGTWYAQATLSEGNLKASLPANSVSVASMKGTGKLYAEVRWSTVVNELALGLIIPEEYTTTTAHNINTGPNSWRMAYHGYAPADIYLVDEGTQIANPAQTVSAGDIFQVAWDTDNGNIWFGYNNNWYDSSGGTTGNPSTGANPTMTATTADLEASLVYIASGNSTGVGVINFGQDSTFAGATTAGGNADENGYGDFKYAVPSGFLALCSANLPEVTIGPNSATTSDQHFNTVLYTGNGSTQSITGVGHQPDFVWMKKRSAAESHILQNSISGNTKFLISNSTAAEDTSTALIQSFDSDGFSLGASSTVNGSSTTYVGWSWKAGGTAVSNTDGSITSSVSANPDAGFSIVSYTGTGTSGTYGHGLGVAPNMILTKDRTDPAAWAVYVSDIGTGKYLELDQTDATTTAAAIYPSVSSTTIGVGVQGDGSITNTSGDNYISYCFANVEGHLKCGSYVGNNSTDGPFSYTGFRPAFVIIKRTDSAAGWVLYDNKRDTHNQMQYILWPNLSNAEYTSNLIHIDFLSNGFKVRNATYGETNASGGTYIYLAFAEAPFKYANAR